MPLSSEPAQSGAMFGLGIASLSGRLLFWVSLLLLIFFGLTIMVLDLVFRDGREEALADVLEVQVIALIAATDPDLAGALHVSADLPEPRFANPGSGMIGALHEGIHGRRLWRSPSAVGYGLELASLPAPGVRHQRTLRLEDGTPVTWLSFGVEWEFDDGRVVPFVFSVAESRRAFEAETQRFRVQLLGWFGVVMILLLFTMAVLLRVLLGPLRQLEQQIGEVENGDRAQLSGTYPTELSGITQNMNTLIRSERQRQTRYRDTLGNLAHSVKTPLAVMRSLLQSRDGEHEAVATLHEQIDKMDEIVGYQLQKAALAGATGLGAEPVAVAEVVEDIRSSLVKVYRDQHPDCSTSVADDLMFHGDKGDLIELFGNLLDNAFKWCRTTVRLDAHQDAQTDGRRGGLVITVEDDGTGLAADDLDRALRRGTRLDEQTAGHGIGLAIVADIVSAYDGELNIDRSALGGARIEIRLPLR